MPTREDRGYCCDCEKAVLVRQDTPNHILHLLISVMLCGLWIPIWIVRAIDGNSRWRCTKCGSDDIEEV